MAVHPSNGREVGSPAQAEDTKDDRFLLDYVSEKRVAETPEERVVQAWLVRLHEDYGYPKQCLQSHPQYRVPKSPSDSEKGSYPVDIAVFDSDSRESSTLKILVETKAPDIKAGRGQLRRYLERCDAVVGAWSNGSEHLYVRKVFLPNGTLKFEEIPDIPRYGQRVEDIGRFLRNQLRIPHDLKSVLQDVRNHLAGNAEGITRDDRLATEIINLLFCKLWDELNTAPAKQVRFYASVADSPNEVAARIKEIFGHVKQEYPDVFRQDEEIGLAPKDLVYVVGTLQNYCIKDATRDAIGDAFEVFIGPAIRGEEGQFFTPRNAVNLVIDMVGLNRDSSVVDPACGSGGFLVVALERIWTQWNEYGKEMGWSDAQLVKTQKEIAERNFAGIDKDDFLVKIAKAYMAIMGDGRGGIFCENSLDLGEGWSEQARKRIRDASFDVVLANPPYGKNIVIEGDFVSRYDLGREWKTSEDGTRLEKTTKTRRKPVPQIMFLERIVRLLKPGGIMGVVLPAGVFASAKTHRYAVQWLTEQVDILAVVDLPNALFKTSGKGGTSTATAVLVARKRKLGENPSSLPVFMAVPEACGHDSRASTLYRKDSQGAFLLNSEGEKIIRDDLPLVAEKYRELAANGFNTERIEFNSNGFLVPRSDLSDGNYVPSSHYARLFAQGEKVADGWGLTSLGELREAGVVSVESAPYSVRKDLYVSGGEIPFVRTSDIVNGQVSISTGASITKEAWKALGCQGFVQEGDILIAKDGDRLIGNVAYIGANQIDIAVQSHILRIRVHPNDVGVSSAMLFAALNGKQFRQAIRGEIFTQDTLGTVGSRLYGIEFPMPYNPATWDATQREAKSLVEQLTESREALVRLRHEWGSL